MDRFVLSIIYKDCDSDGDTRKFYTAVNWLFTSDEADTFFAGDFRLNFSKCIMQSQNILTENGYRFPENPPIHSQKNILDKNLQTALISAAFYSDVSAAQNYSFLQTQTFIGIDREDGLFNALFWTLDSRPKKMRKHLSFCIGAIAAAETYGVALVLMYNDILSPIVVSGNFDGAMLVNKLFFLNNEFRIGSQIPIKAKVYMGLEEPLQEKAKKFFDDSQESANYWNLIDAFASKDPNRFRGASLVKLLGKDNFKKQYALGMFSKEQLVEIFKERDQIFNMPDIIELLRSLPDVVETAEKEIAAEKAQAEKEAAEAAALKKSKGLFHRKPKNTKGKDVASCDETPKKEKENTDVVQDSLDGDIDVYNDDKSVPEKKASDTFVDDDYILESDKKNERKHKKDKERDDFVQDHLDDDRYARDKDRKHDSHKKNVDKEKSHADNDNKERRDHDSSTGKHSQKSNFKSKFENLLKFFAYLGEVVEYIWDEILPIFIPIIILLFAAAFGVGMYFVGVKIIALLPTFFARFAYGVQLTLMVAVSLLCGCILKGKIEEYLNKEKRNKRSSSKED